MKQLRMVNHKLVYSTSVGFQKYDKQLDERRKREKSVENTHAHAHTHTHTHTHTHMYVSCLHTTK
jgi:hypothetical protein